MLEMEHGFRAVDVGARLDPDTDSGDRGRQTSPERLERELRRAGIVRAVVSPGRRDPGEGYLRANNAVARLSVERPFLAFARIDGPRDPSGRAGARLRNLAASRADHHTSPADVEQYAYDDRFHGFAVEPGHDGLPDAETLDELEAVDLPVRVRAGPSFPPEAVAATLCERSLSVILAGFGAPPFDRERANAAVDLLDGHDRLYLDTAGVRLRDVLERALREHPDRVLFGSDAPDSHPNVDAMALLTLDVPEDAMRRAFSKNPSRVVPGLASGE
jgi:predicted TIM-barrel fold metal-dependent hydrolase